MRKATSIASIIGVVLGLLISEARATPIASPNFQNFSEYTFWIRLRPSFFSWLEDDVINPLIQSDKIRNFLNVLAMDALDVDEDADPVLCCCDPSEDPDNCTQGPGGICTGSYPERGRCTELEPEATQYQYARDGSYDAYDCTNTDALGTYCSGLLDTGINIPLIGDLYINLALEDRCNDSTDTCALDFSQADGYIIWYDTTASQVNITNGTTGVQCGFDTWPVAYLEIEFILSDFKVDIDTVTPAPDIETPDPAPGETDCDDQQAGRQASCYVRAVLMGRGDVRIRVGATIYFEHRIGSTPHMQDIGISILRIDIMQDPWVSIQLDWMAVEDNNASPRYEISQKASKLVQFLDLVLRLLADKSDISSGIVGFFGPIPFDLTEDFQDSATHFLPSLHRPLDEDDIWYDIAIGGPDICNVPEYSAFCAAQGIASSGILRSLSCSSQPDWGENDLVLISHMQIDTDFREAPSSGPPPSGNDMPCCTVDAAYASACPYPDPGYPNAPWSSVPSSDANAPLSNNSPISNWQIGIAIHENVLTHALASVIDQGIMCISMHEEAPDLGDTIGKFLTGESLEFLMPDIYEDLEEDYGDDATQIPVIIALNPRYIDVAGTSSCANELGIGANPYPYADILNPTVAEYGIPPTYADVRLCIPAIDVMFWVDGDQTIENLSGNDFPINQAQHPNDLDRRHLIDFGMSLDIGFDLDIYGCGRNLIANTPWWLPPAWGGPGLSGNCTNTPFMRRVNATAYLNPELIGITVTNSYYGVVEPINWISQVADALGIILDSILSMQIQAGFTLRPFIDPNDALAIADVLRIGDCDLSAGGVQNDCDQLADTRIRRDLVNTGFLDIVLTLHGEIEPDFLIEIILDFMEGETPLSPPLERPSSLADLPIVGLLFKGIPEGNFSMPLSEFFAKIKEVAKEYALFKSGKPVNPEIDSLPPETEIVSVETGNASVRIKVTGWDNKTSADKLWYSWKVDGGFWKPWQTEDTIEIKGLLEGWHVVEVKALDEQAIYDPTPAKVRFRIDSVPPKIRDVRYDGRLRFRLRDFGTPPEKILVSWKVNNGKWTEWIPATKIATGEYTGWLPCAIDVPEGSSVTIKAKDERGHVSKFSTIAGSVETSGCSLAGSSSAFAPMIVLLALMIRRIRRK